MYSPYCQKPKLQRMFMNIPIRASPISKTLYLLYRFCHYWTLCTQRKIYQKGLHSSIPFKCRESEFPMPMFPMYRSGRKCFFKPLNILVAYQCFFMEKVYTKVQIDNVTTVLSLARTVYPPQASKTGHFMPIC